jgi:DNA-binding NarL/FixJ family response regulator
MIRTLWLCKNDLFASSISPLLRTYGISIVTLTDPDKVHPYFEAIEADLIIIDANWEKSDHLGISYLETLSHRIADLKAIFVTTTFENRLCRKLEDVGAMGYFYRNSGNIENIVHCIRQVYSGVVCFAETDPTLGELLEEKTKRA